MSEQTAMDAPATQRRMEDQQYTVQIKDGGGFWQDVSWNDDDGNLVTMISVPARTLRKTVVEKALSQAGITPEVGGRMEVRVLDAQSAAPFTVGAVQPPPVLEIGEPA